MQQLVATMMLMIRGYSQTPIYNDNNSNSYNDSSKGITYPRYFYTQRKVESRLSKQKYTSVCKMFLFASSTFCMRYNLIVYDVYQKITHTGQFMMEKDNNFFLR